MRMQSSHTKTDRGLDAYFTPPEEVWSLLAIEGARIPQHVWEPAAGRSLARRYALQLTPRPGSDYDPNSDI